jgi:predicted dehydrogenase
VCEKPLAMTAEESGELPRARGAQRLVHCTNFNIRFYPMIQEAHARVRGGEVGDVWNVHGGYLQDWLLQPTDWNWRLEPDKGGGLRAVGDIGSHWMDLVQFVTGLEIEALFADMATVIPVRQRPKGEVETFAAAADVEREDAPMSTEDLAHILLRFKGGARGSCVISQVSAGRKNSTRFEVDGSAASLAWDGEAHETLWLGPPRHAERDPASEPGRDVGRGAGHDLASGRARRGVRRHVQGAVPRRVPRGGGGRAGRRLPDLPRRPRRERARRGRRAVEPRGAVGGGGTVKLGLMTAAFPDLTLEEVAAWAPATASRCSRWRAGPRAAARSAATRA